MGWVEDKGLTDDELSHGIIDQLAIQNLTTAKGAVLYKKIAISEHRVK